MTATNPVELRMKRNLMREYIKADHTMIALKRPQIITTPAGGRKKGEPSTLAPQMFRIYPFVRRMTQHRQDTPDGDITNVKYVLVGLHNADIQASDYFDYQGGRYSISSVDAVTEDRTAAVAVYHGEASDEPWG